MDIYVPREVKYQLLKIHYKQKVLWTQQFLCSKLHHNICVAAAICER